MKINTGFTLIELMIVVAIIGILASMSVPQYQAYTIRAQMVEALTLVSDFKPRIIEYYRARGEFPATNAEAALPEAKNIIGNYVRTVSIENGAIHIEMGNKANASLDGKLLTLRPIVVKDSPESPISWLCGESSAPEGMAAIGENKTTIHGGFLPTSCRQN